MITFSDEGLTHTAMEAEVLAEDEGKVKRRMGEGFDELQLQLQDKISSPYLLNILGALVHPINLLYTSFSHEKRANGIQRCCS